MYNEQTYSNAGELDKENAYQQLNYRCPKYVRMAV